jgi:hypothetical protein
MPVLVNDDWFTLVFSMGYYIPVLGKNPGSVSLNHPRKKARPAVLYS